jgi:hypothetical protein
MANKQDLERLDSPILAVLCQQVADANKDADTAEKAWQLKREWALLMIRRTPPPPQYKLNEQLKDEKQELVKRMAEFPAGVLPPL